MGISKFLQNELPILLSRSGYEALSEVTSNLFYSQSTTVIDNYRGKLQCIGLELSLWMLICIHYFVFIDFLSFFIEEENFYILDVQVSRACYIKSIFREMYVLLNDGSRRFSRGKKFVRRSIHREPIYPTAHPDERSRWRRHRPSYFSSSSTILSCLTRIFEVNFFPKWTNDGHSARSWLGASGVMRDWYEKLSRLISVSEDGFVESSKDSTRLFPFPRDALWPTQALPFILHENKSEKEDRLPWEM